MFKLFFIYPVIVLICIWLASDVEVKTSINKLQESTFSLQFPKANLRAENSKPWFEFYWQAAHEDKL